MSDKKMGKFSSMIALTNTPPEVMAILDALSTHYNEDMFDAIRQHAETLYRKNAAIVALTKPYIVKDSQGQEFVAYNDREWRKIYMSLNVVLEGIDSEKNPEYEKWSTTKKPHFPDPNLALKFTFDDLKVLMICDAGEIAATTAFLEQRFGKEELRKRLANKSLIIGTQADLMQADL
jgi:hypothetical protein